MWIVGVTLVLAALVAGALVYSLLSVVAALRYLSLAGPALPSTAAGVEPVSILKPLAGLDLDLESNLRTFFEQNYPSFEILFAVRDAADPAVAVVEKLRGEFSHIATRVLIVGEPPYPNAKVFSLDRMMEAAANDLVMMSGSDILVTPDLLRTAAAEFADGKVGV